MHELKVTEVGGLLAVVLPNALLAKLGVDSGDTLQAFETKDGFELRPVDAEDSRQLEVAERVMSQHRNVLRRLAQ